jgi:hypothetical protein
MTRNPFLNALSATAYISLVASLMYYLPGKLAPAPGVMAIVAVLSLFVLSAALMGYFFLYQPVRLLIEGNVKDATKLFLLTVFSFACITGVMVLAWLSLSAILR